MTRALRVTLPGREVGALQRQDDGRVSWEPEAVWEQDGQHPRLGVTFLREPGRRLSPRGLPPWFENLLPEEGGELRRRLCALHGLREGQSFALLTALGRDLPGGVEIFDEEGEPLSVSSTLDENTPDEGIRTTHFSSLAGMQMKFTMSMLNERLSLPAKSGTEQWIVKLPGEAYSDLPEVENCTMSWARQAGLSVPDHHVVNVESLTGLPSSWVGGIARAFAVRRFDRRKDGTKIHQEDLCQALDLAPRDRYGDTNPRVSFDGVLRFVVDVCGEAQGRELARRLGFMIASGNDDMHLKNWSFIWGEASLPTLAPCYDLVSTVTWERFGWSDHQAPTLALPMGGCRDFARLDDSALRTFGERSGQAWAQQEVLDAIGAARAAWSAAKESAPEAMQRAIETHFRRVPLLAGTGSPSGDGASS